MSNSTSFSQNQNQLNNIFSDSNFGQEPNIRKAKFMVSSKRIYTLEFDHNIEMQELKTMIQKAAHLKKNSFGLYCNGVDYTEYTEETFESFFPDQNLVIFTLELIKGEEEYDESELLLQINTPCPEHDYKFLLYYCFDCGKSICSECFTNGAHKGHKIQDKCFYLLPSKYLVDKMFENWSKNPYEDYKISVDLNEYKNKLDNELFKQLFDMLNEVQKKCNLLIDKYNLINQNSLSNLRDSVRDIKVSCIKALDEYKDIINIKDIINNQEIFIDFDHTYKDIRNKQKEKFKENLLKFQELNKGVSMLVENLINDIVQMINGILIKALDIKQYEDVEQKINLKLIKPVNKNDIINQISDKKMKKKRNKRLQRNTINTYNYNKLVNNIAERVEQKLDKKIDKIENSKARNTMGTQETIDKYFKNVDNKNKNEDSFDNEIQEIIKNDKSFKNSDDKNKNEDICYNNEEQISNGKNNNNINNNYSVDSSLNVPIFQNTIKKGEIQNNQTINSPNNNIPELNLNPNNKIYDFNQNNNPNSSELQTENLDQNKKQDFLKPIFDYNENNTLINPNLDNSNITNENPFLNLNNNKQNGNDNSEVNNIFGSQVDENKNNNIFNSIPNKKMNNTIDFFSDNNNIISPIVGDDNQLNTNKGRIFSNNSSFKDESYMFNNSNSAQPNKLALTTIKDIESNSISSPFSSKNNLNNDNNNSQIPCNNNNQQIISLSSPFVHYGNGNIFKDEKNNTTINGNLNQKNENNMNNNKISDVQNTKNNINHFDKKYLAGIAYNCKTILEEANESESEAKVKEGKNIKIEYYLKKPFILSPIPTTDKVKIITEDESDENIITLPFSENLNISSFLYNCAYCNHNQKLYVSGGDLNPPSNSFSNKFFMINLSNLSKDNNNTNSCIIELSPMVQCRSGHSMIANNNEIYAVGGEGLNSVEKYDLSKNRWIEMPSMIRKRSNAMLLIDNGYLYAFFGKGENGEYPESIERLNIQNDKSVWEMILFSNPNNIDTKLYGCGLFQVDELIYFLGGKCNEQNADSIFYFNLNDRRFDISNAKLKWKESFRENQLFQLGDRMVQVIDGKFFGIYLKILIE